MQDPMHSATARCSSCRAKPRSSPPPLPTCKA
jgi:hypothetical protein